MTNRWITAGAGLIVALALASCSSAATATMTESATPSASPSAETTPTLEATPTLETTSPSPATTATAPSATATPHDPGPVATATPTPAPAGPTVAVLSQRCSSGKLIVVVGADADSTYRKGISSVVTERQNEYGVWLDFNATWMGPETGSGNQWTATITHLDGDTVRITATSASHSTKTITAAITASC